MNPHLDPLVPEYIRKLIPYLPGKPIEETQREFNLKSVIKLASNENPLGPSLKTKKAIVQNLSDLHRYPDSSGFRLKQALAEKLQVDSKSIILGNGSNDVIDQVIRTFSIPGDSLVTHFGAFIAYKISAQIHGVSVLEAQLDENLEVDVHSILKLAKDNPKVRMIFLANPNNPTGTYIKTPDLQLFLKKLAKIRNGSIVLVLDYAYWEYVTARDLPDGVSLLKDYPNLVILRTFSKVYGLAGMRVGYGVSSPSLIAHLEKVRQPFNSNQLGLIAAETALNDAAYVAKAKQTNSLGMYFWKNELQRLGIPYWNSQGNFILVNVKKGLGQSGPEVFQTCLSKGVIFRPVANYGIPDALRITIGMPSENKRAIKVLESLTQGKSNRGSYK